MFKSILTLAAIVSGLLLSACQSSSNPPGRPMSLQGETVAVVNGVEIHAAEVGLNTTARQQMRQAISPENSLKEVINIELIRQAAVKENLHQDTQVAAEINRQSTGILISAYVRKLLENTPVTDEVVQKAYDEYVTTLPGKEYKSRHILSKSKEDAEAVIAALKGGKNFTQLAKEKSTGPSGPDGGDLGWASPDNYVPEFSQALQQLEPGQYTQQPVQTQFGWHVILLEETRDAQAPSLEELRPQLQRMAANAIIEEKIEELRSAAKIDVKTEAAPTTEEPAAEEPAATVE